VSTCSTDCTASFPSPEKGFLNDEREKANRSESLSSFPHFLILKELCEEKSFQLRASSYGQHLTTGRLQKMKAYMLKITELRLKFDELLSCQTKFGIAYL